MDAKDIFEKLQKKDAEKEFQEKAARSNNKKSPPNKPKKEVFDMYHRLSSSDEDAREVMAPSVHRVHDDDEKEAEVHSDAEKKAHILNELLMGLNQFIGDPDAAWLFRELHFKWVQANPGSSEDAAKPAAGQAEDNLDSDEDNPSSDEDVTKPAAEQAEDDLDSGEDDPSSDDNVAKLAKDDKKIQGRRSEAIVPDFRSRQGSFDAAKETPSTAMTARGSSFGKGPRW